MSAQTIPRSLPLGRILAALSILGVSLAVAPRAEAGFHLIKVREVYAGGPDHAGAQFIELQFNAGGQSAINGHTVTVYNSSGMPIPAATYTISGVTNFTNQASILFATAAAATYFGVTAEVTMSTASIPAAGGKVCMESIDCVSWGTYSGGVGYMGTSTGTPFNAPEGLVPGASAERIITRGNPAILDPDPSADDTGDSAGDFAFAEPTPRNNQGISGTASAKLGFSAAEYTVFESDGSATITVTRNTSLGTVDVSYSTQDGTATSPADYASTSGSFTFLAGDTSKTFTVSVVSDLTDEFTETVKLKLRSLTSGVYSQIESTLKIQGELSPSPPGAPTNLTATATTSSSIALSWTAPTSTGGADITSYKVYRSTTAGGPYTWIGSSATTTFTATMLSPSTIYYFRVSAVNSAGEGPQSTEASATTPAAPPSAPLNVRVTPGLLQLIVEWDPPASTGGVALTQYIVERAPLPGSLWGPGVTVTAPMTTYTDSTCTLSLHKVCYYRIRAVNASGQPGPYSNSTFSATNFRYFMVAPKP